MNRLPDEPISDALESNITNRLSTDMPGVLIDAETIRNIALIIKAFFEDVDPKDIVEAGMLRRKGEERNVFYSGKVWIRSHTEPVDGEVNTVYINEELPLNDKESFVKEIEKAFPPKSISNFLAIFVIGSLYYQETFILTLAKALKPNGRLLIIDVEKGAIPPRSSNKTPDDSGYSVEGMKNIDPLSAIQGFNPSDLKIRFAFIPIMSNYLMDVKMLNQDIGQSIKVWALTLRRKP